MGKRIEYTPDTVVGSYGVVFIEELPKQNKKRRGRFQCPICLTSFETDIYSVTSGHTKSCGCLRARDISNQRFGECIAIKPAFQDEEKRWIWECKCDCGRTFYAPVHYLTQGAMKRCRQCTEEKIRSARFIDFSGQKIDNLTAIQLTGDKDDTGALLWLCHCDCGNDVVVSSTYLSSDHFKYKSCGCHHQYHQSLGEKKVKEALEQLGIDFIEQQRFDSCINFDTGYKLPFDFYIPSMNLLIEYDGEQHFRPWIYDRTEQDYEGRLKRDRIKNQWSADNKIDLIRLSYKDYFKIDCNSIGYILKERRITDGWDSQILLHN